MSAILPRRSRWSGRSPDRADAPTASRRLARSWRSCRRPAARTGRRCWRDCSTAPSIEARYAIIKLVTGGLRIGVSARLAKQALADFGTGRRRRDRGALARADAALRRRCSPGWRARPTSRSERAKALFRPVMLSTPGRATATSRSSTRPIMPPNGNGTASACRRCRRAASRRLYSRTGDDMSGAFPDLVDAMDFDGALDGELLVGDPPEATGTFSDLQQRLNRKTVSPKMREQYPGLHALLRPADDRRRGLARPALRRAARRAWKPSSATLDPTRFDLSPLVALRRLGRRSTRCARTRRTR